MLYYNINPMRRDYDLRESTFSAIAVMPEVIACHLVSGEADHHLEVVVPDLEHYQQFLVEKNFSIFCFDNRTLCRTPR